MLNVADVWGQTPAAAIVLLTVYWFGKLFTKSIAPLAASITRPDGIAENTPALAPLLNVTWGILAPEQ